MLARSRLAVSALPATRSLPQQLRWSDGKLDTATVTADSRSTHGLVIQRSWEKAEGDRVVAPSALLARLFAAFHSRAVAAASPQDRRSAAAKVQELLGVLAESAQAELRKRADKEAAGPVAAGAGAAARARDLEPVPALATVLELLNGIFAKRPADEAAAAAEVAALLGPFFARGAETELGKCLCEQLVCHALQAALERLPKVVGEATLDAAAAFWLDWAVLKLAEGFPSASGEAPAADVFTVRPACCAPLVPALAAAVERLTSGAADAGVAPAETNLSLARALVLLLSALAAVLHAADKGRSAPPPDARAPLLALCKLPFLRSFLRLCNGVAPDDVPEAARAVHGVLARTDAAALQLPAAFTVAERAAMAFSAVAARLCDDHLQETLAGCKDALAEEPLVPEPGPPVSLGLPQLCCVMVLTAARVQEARRGWLRNAGAAAHAGMLACRDIIQLLEEAILSPRAEGDPSAPSAAAAAAAAVTPLGAAVQAELFVLLSEGNLAEKGVAQDLLGRAGFVRALVRRLGEAEQAEAVLPMEGARERRAVVRVAMHLAALGASSEVVVAALAASLRAVAASGIDSEDISQSLMPTLLRAAKAGVVLRDYGADAPKRLLRRRAPTVPTPCLSIPHATRKQSIRPSRLLSHANTTQPTIHFPRRHPPLALLPPPASSRSCSSPSTPSGPTSRTRTSTPS